MRQLNRLGIITLGLMILLAGSVLARPPQQANLFEVFLSDIRGDLETLADVVYGGSRPDSWTGNMNYSSQTIIADIWFDNEQLADEIFGQSVRPANWFGATSSNVDLVARNIRHDLELSADEFLGVDARPGAWIGAPRIYRCDRTTQNLVFLLNSIYSIQTQTPESVVNYCEAVGIEIEDELVDVTFGETDLLDQLPDLVLATRGDLERLADETLGLNTRPDSWIGNRDINSPTLSADNFSDLARLADELLGDDRRPEGWIGNFSSSAPVAYRSIRHDLELLADVQLGEGSRPRGWQGEDPLARCNPLIQNLVLVVQQNFEFSVNVSPGASDFCEQVEASANLQAENPPVEDIEEVDDRFIAEAEYAFAYLDKAAIEFMGSIPPGTEFRAWYRNFGESTMMFVSGEDFAVYIDQRWTTLSQDAFDLLPLLDGVEPLTFCDAAWCNGPGPTPTPTGRSPLLEIISQATPPATIASESVQQEGKQLVSWNHIRINYLLQKPEVGTAQVSLEICREAAQIACEPVLSVFNNATGVQVPVISQLNGLNVYELPYGYSTNLVVEGDTLFSTDIWLNDPTLLTPGAEQSIQQTPPAAGGGEVQPTIEPTAAG